MASDERLLSVYEQLRRMAAAQVRPGVSLDPTDLVHEAFLRLHDGGWESESHFRAVACLAMRHVLIDRARRRQALRRGGERDRTTLSGLGVEASDDGLLAMDEVLTRLQERDPRKAQIVQMRVFGGMELEEIAGIQAISLATVKREWRAARAWIAGVLG